MAEQAPGGSVLRRRKRVLLVAVGAVVLLTAGGLVGAGHVKSPAQVEAEQAPVAPGVLTAPVTRQVVGATVVLRGTVAGAEDVQATPAPLGAGSGEGAAKPLVTAVRKNAGDLVAAGDVIVEVSGRPLVALHGDEPAYRDLRPGDSGKDVTELRRALQELGFPSAGDAEGVFGTATKRAVLTYYRKIGFAPPTTGGSTGQDEAAVQTAQDAVTQAQRRVRDATDAANAGGGPAYAVDDAKADLGTAQKRLVDLQARTGAMVPMAEVVFLPSFPARVTKSGGKVGAPVEAPLVTLSSGRLGISGRLDPADRGLVQPGATAAIDSEVTGFHGTGKVSAVGDQVPDSAKQGQPGQQSQTQGQASGQSYVPVTVLPDAALDPGLIGQDVRLTLKFGQTAGPVLAVPSAAVTSSADGRTHVVVVAAGGAQRTVEVRAGKSGAGMVEVTPVDGGLAEGDRVVIGR